MPNERKFPLPPKYQEHLNEVQTLSRITPFLSFFSRFGVGGRRLKAFVREIQHLKRASENLAKLPAAFHDAFSERGWLISESTNSETARAALVAHRKGHSDDAEDLLAADYLGDRLDVVVMRLCYLEEFRLRRAQLDEASALTREGRYLAAVPLLLIVADGVGTDPFGKSIFAEGTDLNELHSLAGHPEGLPRLIRKMCEARRKTNRRDLTFPYRNGILHGRDLGYGNRLITAKCWSLLTNIQDVIQARDEAQAREPEPVPSLREALARSAEVQKMKRRIAEWVPRPVTEERICVSTETRSSMNEDEPEAAMVEFLQAWKADNYGRMSQMTLTVDKTSVNQRAGEIRSLMDGLKLTNATITRVEDKALARAEIMVDLTARVDSQERSDSFVFTTICVGEKDESAVRGDEGAHWRIRPDYQDWVVRYHLEI